MPIDSTIDTTALSKELNSKKNALLEIDANIDRIVRRIEMLAYVNPLNIAQERKKFFQSKYLYNPQFKYRKVKFNPYKIHRLLFSQRLERIENEEIRGLYKDIIYTYSGLLQCIETIAQPNNQFYFNSLRFFGTPTEKTVENARFILHFTADETSDTSREQLFSTEEATDFFKNFREQYDFDFDIKTSSAMSAAAMVSNSQRALILKKNHQYSKHELNVLGHHEIGVHLVTTFNAAEQHLTIFSNGFPNYEETQEGLAVMSEYMSGNLTVNRLKELAYRVMAVDSLTKGYDFQDTFDLLHNQLKLDRERSFGITLRTHRGGGWTKDALYLSGLKKVYDYYKSGKDLDLIMLGKCSLDFNDGVQAMKQEGYVKEIKHRSNSFDRCLNQSEQVEFILKNLK